MHSIQHSITSTSKKRRKNRPKEWLLLLPYVMRNYSGEGHELRAEEICEIITNSLSSEDGELVLEAESLRKYLDSIITNQYEDGKEIENNYEMILRRELGGQIKRKGNKRNLKYYFVPDFEDTRRMDSYSYPSAEIVSEKMYFDPERSEITKGLMEYCNKL